MRNEIKVDRLKELFYKSAMSRHELGLEASEKDVEVISEVINLFKEKVLTVDQSTRILEDVKTILPLITTL